MNHDIQRDNEGLTLAEVLARIVEDDRFKVYFPYLPSLNQLIWKKSPGDNGIQVGWFQPSPDVPKEALWACSHPSSKRGNGKQVDYRTTGGKNIRARAKVNIKSVTWSEPFRHIMRNGDHGTRMDKIETVLLFYFLEQGLIRSIDFELIGFDKFRDAVQCIYNAPRGSKRYNPRTSFIGGQACATVKSEYDFDPDTDWAQASGPVIKRSWETQQEGLLEEKPKTEARTMDNLTMFNQITENVRRQCDEELAAAKIEIRDLRNRIMIAEKDLTASNAAAQSRSVSMNATIFATQIELEVAVTQVGGLKQRVSQLESQVVSQAADLVSKTKMLDEEREAKKEAEQKQLEMIKELERLREFKSACLAFASGLTAQHGSK